MSEVNQEEGMPPELTVKLLPHQVQGIQWMMSREEGKKKGGILADDMVRTLAGR
jgi:SNF2 family DNA or RNA helicase